MDKIELVDEQLFLAIQEHFQTGHFQFLLVALLLAGLKAAQGEALGAAHHVDAQGYRGAHGRGRIAHLYGGVALEQIGARPVQHVVDFGIHGIERHFQRHGFRHAQGRTVDLAGNAGTGQAFRHVGQLRQVDGGHADLVSTVMIDAESYGLFREILSHAMPP